MKSKKLLSILLVLSLAMCIFPASAFADGTGADAGAYSIPVDYINANDVHLRSGPGTSYSSGGQLYYNDYVQIDPDNTGTRVYYGDGYSWYYVLVLSGQCQGLRGYVACKYVTHGNI